MITPTINININGSSIHDLVDPRLKAMGHLTDAIEALKLATPNGRDYRDRIDLEIDRGIHFSRLDVLRLLREALMAEAVHIKEQGE